MKLKKPHNDGLFLGASKLQYPVKIKTPSPANAKVIITQLGGPDGETGASMRYLHQRYSCPYDKITGTLTDIGTEELAPESYQFMMQQKEQVHLLLLFFLLHHINASCDALCG